ncbi:MAG TPA: TlpA disulfide reductase family protein [Steroidobacteraceae bacterium]|nr:TlpA disulfide reductase family protein [Steroidobacteraceae bacterium]
MKAIALATALLLMSTGCSKRETAAVGELRQSHHQVTGTFLTPTSDHRFLAGDVRDDELELSTFDGAHAYLYRAKILRGGRLEGTWWSGLAWQESFSARRDDAATLGDAESATAMRVAARALDFTFPDLGGQPVSLQDPRFTGKVLVVTLGGSWCPNCHDEAAFLAPYYLQNRERGLEVVALMFEHFGAFEKAAAATRRFCDRYGIEYATLIAGISDEEDAAKRLPQLHAVHAFPTTLFIDRAGRVRRIHTGFSGPATGAHHQRLIEDFDATVEQLLSETASGV